MLKKPDQLEGLNNKAELNTSSKPDYLPIGKPVFSQALLLPIIAFVITLLVASLVSLSVYFEGKELVKEQEKKELISKISLIEPIFNNLYNNAYRDVDFLGGTPPIQGLITSIENKTSADYKLWRARLEQIFSEFLRVKPNYLQVRYISFAESGQELVNVKRQGVDLYQTPPDLLQKKASSAYMNLEHYQASEGIYFSKIELNREYEQLELPHRPVLRIAKAVYSKSTNEVFGIVIVNVDFGHVISKVEQRNAKDTVFYLANQEGEFIHHPEQEKTFGFDRGQSWLLQDSFSALKAAITKQVKNYTLQKDDLQAKSQSLGFYHLFYPLKNEFNIRPLRLLLIHENTDKTLVSSLNKGLLLGLTLAFFVMILSILAARRLVSPLKKMTEAVKDYSNFGLISPLPVDSKDEFGVLARSFHNMLIAKEEKDRELELQKFALDQHAIVSVTDIEGRITFVNDRFCDVTGYSADELLGNDHRLIKTDRQDLQFYEKMYATITQGLVWNGELCNKTKDGTEFWVDATIVPHLDDDGQPQSYIAIRSDITERKEAELALIKAKELAEAGTRSKSEFLASMSHEIRTPMNGVIGMLGLLTESDLDKNQRRHADIAQSSAHSLLALINDILDFSKVEAGKLELEYVAFDPLKLLIEFVESMAFPAQEKGLELVLDATLVEHIIVKGDPGRIRQILTNLVGNAIKFTHDGEVIITASLTTKDEKISVFQCAITDTGIGISEHGIKTLFDSFSQADTSTTRNYGGTGLGLSIARKLSQMMGGDIKVDSAENEGSCFTFDVCLDQCERKFTSDYTLDLTQQEVLIVDDNAASRTVLKNQLQTWGARVSEAGDSVSALSLCNAKLGQGENTLFDIIIVDEYMSGMDGFGLAKMIRHNPRLKSMKKVMMTSMTNPKQVNTLTELGFSSHFTKPVNVVNLYEALKEALSLSKDNESSTLEEKKTDGAISTVSHIWPSGTRLLLVEDNVVNQMVAKGILKKFGLNVSVAVDGFDALEQIRNCTDENRFSLVLMDCQMPKMDGYEATRQIRSGQAGEQYKNLPILAMTANVMSGDRERCLAAGMNDYLSKPFSANSLQTKLFRWLLEKETNTDTLDD